MDRGNGECAADEATLTDTNPNQLEREFVFKVVVMGSYNVGKTTFIKRLLHTRLPATHGHQLHQKAANADADDADDAGDTDDDALSSDPDDIPVTPTVGTDFYSRVVRHVLPHTNVRLQLWDTAGLAKYTAVNETTYKNSSLVLCLFDISDKTSLEEVTERHLAQAAEFIPDLEQDGIFVIATKMDLLDPAEDVARAQSQRRAASPEAAFCTTGGDGTADADDDETTELTSSNVGGGGGRKGRGKAVTPADLITVKDVQEAVLDLFSEVHYAEVSAKKRTGMSALLLRVCLALLRNQGELTEEAERNIFEGREDEATCDIELDSGLARDTPGSGNAPRTAAVPGRTKPDATCDSSPTSADAQKPAVPATKPVAVVTQPGSPNSTEGPPSVDATASHRLTEANRPAASAIDKAAAAAASPTGGDAASWRQSGFSFDMPAPVALSDTGIFSPSSLPPTPAEISTASITGRPGRGPAHADPNADTEAPTEGSGKGPARAAGAKRAAPRPRASETKEERLAREKAEMAALLGKRGTGDAVAEGAAEDRFRKNDLDAVEEEVPVDAPAKGRKFRSILDDVHEETERKRLDAGNAASDGDEDGLRMQDTIRERFADIDKNAELDKLAAKEAEKREKKYGPKHAAKEKKTVDTSVADLYKKKKAKEKCKCAVM